MATKTQLKEIACNYKIATTKYRYKFCEDSGKAKLVEVRRNCKSPLKKKI